MFDRFNVARTWVNISHCGYWAFCLLGVIRSRGCNGRFALPNSCSFLLSHVLFKPKFFTQRCCEPPSPPFFWACVDRAARLQRCGGAFLLPDGISCAPQKGFSCWLSIPANQQVSMIVANIMHLFALYCYSPKDPI